MTELVHDPRAPRTTGSGDPYHPTWGDLGEFTPRAPRTLRHTDPGTPAPTSTATRTPCSRGCDPGTGACWCE